jgi:citrate lyase beta subunit
MTLTPRVRLTAADLADVERVMAPADDALARDFPGDDGSRQPVHTVYVPADRVVPGLAAAHGAAAREALDEHAGDPESLADAVGADAGGVAAVWPLLLAKLDREPVEDLRIDLEDGYRGHSGEEEDAHAVAAVRALAADPPPYWGVRFKCFEAPTRARGLRTLDLVLGTALEAGPLPDGFRLTLPKVTSVEQVQAMALACERLEAAYALDAGRLRFEVQVETPQVVLGPDGTATVARLVHAAGGRCEGLHFGTYDYTAALGIAAGQQAMDHPVADHAKNVMLLAAAGTGVRVSDGSTNVLPVGPSGQVRSAWALHFRLVRRSLERGLYQGWDLHPAQLPTRYLATFLFFRSGLEAAATRLRDYLAGTACGVLDEPATARALAGFVTRGVHCGAVTTAEAETLTGAPMASLTGLALRRAG